MTRRGVIMVLLGLGVVVAALGLGRIRFDPDVLGMLPAEMPEVKGLKEFRESFAREDELVILLEGGAAEEGLLGDYAASLSKKLEVSGVAKRAMWRPQWEEQGGGLAELLAYFWLNGPADAVAKKAEVLSPENAEVTVGKSLEEVATAMEGFDLAMRSHDPLGLLRHPSLEPLLSEAEEGVSGFESADGRGHLILVDAPQPVAGYREAGEWLAKVRKMIDDWQRTEGDGVRVSLTGEPAFSSEIGGAMERDMRGTAGITAGLVGLLFWLMQRRLALLGGLVVMLGLVFVSALGMAGWIYGELSIMAAGFAAILIGLAVDYGVLICQESKSAGGDGKRLLRATGVSVAWAAITTAVVFLALNLSGLPGIAQLGTMVACGILAGAALMLGFYLPFVAKVGGAELVRENRNCWVLNRRLSGAVVLSLVILGTGTLIWHGPPAVGFDARMVRPRNSAALAAYERVKSLFPEWGIDSLRVVVKAPDDESMRERVEKAREKLTTNPAFESVVLPVTWWPDLARQEANREALASLAERSPELLRLAGEAGYTEEGVTLGRAVLEEWQRMSALNGVVIPQSSSARDMMRNFISFDDDGGGSMAGVVKLEKGVPVEALDYDGIRKLSDDGVWLVGWEMLRPAVAPLVKKDLTQVFLPMAFLMVAMLAVVFRSWREVGFCLSAMALTALLLLSAMSWLGIGWNFLNIAATPLLLGTGIDYGIHVGLTLKRNGGDLPGMWHGTGKAVLFCGGSTAIGFGSLCFASNDAMASLGAVAVIGILGSVLVSVFLLPSWFLKAPKDGKPCQWN